jgi:integrase
MALTFVRTGELIGAKWSEFDLDAARWNIPAERMKMRTPHIVPLSKQAVAVVEKLQAVTAGVILTPQRRSKSDPPERR